MRGLAQRPQKAYKVAEMYNLLNTVWNLQMSTTYHFDDKHYGYYIPYKRMKAHSQVLDKNTLRKYRSNLLAFLPHTMTALEGPKTRASKCMKQPILG